MSWRTHAIIGANAVWLTALLGQTDERTIIFVPLAALAALLPDIDAKEAKIFYILGKIFSLFKGAFSHRAFFHSLLAVSIVFVVSFIFLRQFHPLLPLVLTLAYASHPIIDGFNRL